MPTLVTILVFFGNRNAREAYRSRMILSKSTITKNTRDCIIIADLVRLDLKVVTDNIRGLRANMICLDDTVAHESCANSHEMLEFYKNRNHILKP